MAKRTPVIWVPQKPMKNKFGRAFKNLGSKPVTEIFNEITAQILSRTWGGLGRARK